MRKFFISAICLFASYSLFAQISIDKVEEDGSRIIVSDYHNIYTEWSSAAAACVEYILIPEDDVEHYEILFSLNEGKMQFDEGRKLLLKFKDGSVMELSNTEVIGPADYKYSVTKYGTNYYTYPSYKVTEEQLKQIISGEVVKIRIENNIEYFDREIKKNKFSKAIQQSYEAILSKKQVKNDVYTNF